MQWQEQSRACRFYLLAVYLTAIPLAIFCFRAKNDFSLQWLLFTLISLCIATVNVRLPKLSVVISMADVFIILILTKFGAGAALITYWSASMMAQITEL